MKSALIAVLLLAGYAIYETYRLVDTHRFNDALRRGDYADAARYPGYAGSFAAAYALEREDRFREALIAYNRIERNASGQLDPVVKFNMGNAYLRQGIAAEKSGQRDLSVPMLELAKQSYREVLQADSRNWDAKYNLERVLGLAPDPEDEESAEENMPEHSQRALAILPVMEELP